MAWYGAVQYIRYYSILHILAHSKNELMQWRGVRCLSVCPSVNFCANRSFSRTNGRIATKLAHDGLQVSLHPGCAQGQGQGQKSRDTRTFLDSWNELLRHCLIDGLVIVFHRILPIYDTSKSLLLQGTVSETEALELPVREFWNNLPRGLRTLDISYKHFKTLLKTYMFD